MIDTPPPATTAVWTRLLRSAGAVRDRVETDLKSAGLPPLDWYDALWEIGKSGDAGIRPLALQTRLLLPQYGLSRLIERLVRAGLVRREECADDGRGHVVTLTPQGRYMRERMWPVYAAALTIGITDRLSSAEALTLARLLGRLLPGEATDPREAGNGP